jgi:pimeloyl-ACP methyl ester carboxylesterase
MLRAFRATHTTRMHAVGGHVWDAIESGSGERTVVLLPGGGGSAESQFPLILGLETRASVLSIGCPAGVTTIESVIAGLERLLDEYAVATCFLLGHSLGGVFAEAFAIAHPERLDGLVLANTGRYTPPRAKMVGTVLRAARYLPARAITGFLSSRINRLLHGHPDREFWLDYFTHDELVRVGKEGIVNRGLCIEDAIFHWSGARPYQGPVLIFESDNETGFTPEERLELRSSYPQAVVHTFCGAGHLSSITRTNEFVDEVFRFVHVPLSAPAY